jgi:hypothetical protein
MGQALLMFWKTLSIHHHHHHRQRHHTWPEQPQKMSLEWNNMLSCSIFTSHASFEVAFASFMILNLLTRDHLRKALQNTDMLWCFMIFAFSSDFL